MNSPATPRRRSTVNPNSRTDEVSDALDRLCGLSPMPDDFVPSVTELRMLFKLASETPVSSDIPERLGAYEKLEWLRSSGMGEIWRFRDTRVGRDVVIKFVRKDRLISQAQKKFVNEQKALARLHHTSIVPVFDVGREHGVLFLVMPHLRGMNLDQVIRGGHRNPTEAHERSFDPHSQLAQAIRARRKCSRPQTAGIPEGQADPSVLTAAYSDEYHRFVVRVMHQIAVAVQHVHERAIVHGDLKPANIMVDPEGRATLIDFGLAVDLSVSGAETERTLSGTDSYMSPELFCGAPVSPASDIWAFGVTLYEVLTLRRAFDSDERDPARRRLAIRDSVLQNGPVPPQRTVEHLPDELSRICQKAMEADPAMRYATMRDMAADLEAWLERRPISLEPPWSLHRLALWHARNPIRTWLAFAAGILLLLSCLVGMLFTEARAAAQEKARAHERQVGIRTIERIQSDVHFGPMPQAHLAHNQNPQSWSRRIWAYGTSVPALEGEEDLRDALANSLIDFDAELIYDDTSTCTDLLALDAEGRRLATGGAPAYNGELPETSPRILDIGTQQWQESQVKGYGPVAFRFDGVPIALIPDSADSTCVQLWNIATSELISKLRVDGSGEVIDRRPILMLSVDGKYAAAGVTVRRVDGSEVMMISLWDAETAKLLHQVDAATAESLAITPDGRLLAIGHSDGSVSLWQPGQASPLIRFQQNRHAIRSLAFGRDLRRHLKLEAPDGVADDVLASCGWIMAAGDTAGGVTVWDSRNRKERTVLRGGLFERLQLAFSNDSTLLFSVGRSPGLIWDVATGDRVLQWYQSNYQPGLAVRANGLFASAGNPKFQQPKASGLRIQRLVADRGGRVLRGLREPPITLTVSQDGNRIAALTTQFEAAVWTSEGTLLHVLELPPAPFADNATISFSPDSQELFCCNGDTAFTFDLATGTLRRHWDVAPAYVNESAWTPDGRHLYFARKELNDRRDFPDSERYPVSEFPRTVRVYDLLQDHRSDEPILELRGFAERTYGIQLAENGLMMIAGREPENSHLHTVECWDLATRRRLWSQTTEYVTNIGHKLSESGQILLQLQNPDLCQYQPVDARTRKSLAPQMTNPFRLDQYGRYFMASGNIRDVVNDERHLLLYSNEGNVPLVRILQEDARIHDTRFFEHAGRPHLTWSNNRGHVVVLDIEEVRRRLDSVGLGWQEPKPLFTGDR